MAKTKQPETPKYETPKPKYEGKQLSPEEFAKLEQHKQAEMAKKAKELLNISIELGAKPVKKKIDENSVEVGGIKVSKA